MKIKIISLLFCLSFSSAIFAQKTNPIIFADAGLGLGNDMTAKAGFLFYTSLNFEKNKNLFTARYSQLNELNLQIIPVTFIAFPIVTNDVTAKELALLYGRRYISDNFSYSFSGGISTIFYEQNLKTDNENYYKQTTNYIGLPLEFSIKWFKREKSPYRIYGLIPVGKPTALGNSIGFKLIGNISRHSYIGFGLDFGIGYHKEY